MFQLLHHRVVTLEKINTDLEKRLEDQARLTMKAEKMYTDLNQSWTDRNAALKQVYIYASEGRKVKCTFQEIEEWKDKYNKQVKITDRKEEKLTRTERELYGLLQRKYELMGDRRNPSNEDGSVPPKPPPPPSLIPSTSHDDLQVPKHINISIVT